MNWLPSVQFQDVHDKRTASAVAGTGIWFQTHDLYQGWKTSAHSSLLWVKGKPGCGKSVLAALTLDELYQLKTDDVAIAHFYCDSSSSEKSSYLYLLTTMLKQISVQSPRLEHNLEDKYNAKSLVQARGPGANEVEKLLPAVISGFPQAFIVLDGLDELSEFERFLKFVPLLLRETGCTLRVIVFSRDYLPMQNAFKQYPQVHVDKGANAEDIKTFIFNRLSLDDPVWDSELLDVAKAVLLDRAQGMFLYVSQTVGRLRGSLPPNQLLERLMSLPKGLTKAYEDNLKRILNQDDEDNKELTLKILLWIANVIRPLSRRELLEALSIRHGKKAIDKGDRWGTDREFTTFCAELVSLDQDDFYHLVHTSLRDYLFELRDATAPELGDYRQMQLHAGRSLSEACLTYLLFDQFSSGPTATAEELARLMRDNVLLRYAAENWGTHVAQASEDAPVDLVWRFIDCENARNLSLQIIMLEDKIYPFPGSSSPLHMLAYFGLSNLAKSRPHLRKLKTQIDGFGLLPLDYAMLGRKREMCLWLLEEDEGSAVQASPLLARYSVYHVAIAFEWHDVLERLILNGYSVEHVSSNKQRTPLAEAAGQGNEWAFNRLLEAKADVNAKDAEGKNALMIALDEGHQSLVAPLLQHGTDINAQDNDGVSALHTAADTGDLDAVRLLLDRGPLLQATSEKFWNQTPIHLAAEHDYDDVTRELHKFGAGLEVTCMGGFRPIHVAAFHDSLKVARLLATLNAEMNSLSEDNRTVLHIAAENSSVEFVELVLATRPDINAKEKEASNTPLHSAASAGNAAVCKLLLDRGASIDLPNVTNHTALHLAVLEGHLETAKLLLEHKFSPKKPAVFESPVLHYAANEGKSELIAPLIEAGADPEARNSHGHRALHFAARKGHTDFVEQLFTAVPNLGPNSQDVDGKTALHLAAIAGHLETVRLLQDKGAQQDIPDSSKNLAIHYAAWDGHVEVIEQLVSDDNINVQGYNGRTLLSISALRGHNNNRILWLLARHAMLELADDNQATPLMNAVQMNHATIANLLIKKGADVHAKDGEDRTVLHQAARNGDYDLVKLLLERGCDARAVSKFGDTPFLEAVYSNNLKMVDFFFEHGVDGSNDQNKLGTTCVHAAAEEGNVQMLVKLLNAGANPDLVDRVGRNAMLLAAMEGRHALIELLLRLGLHVEGPEDSYWTPLGTACEAGYVRFAEILLLNEANIHKRMKHTKMTPLHHAAAMRRPQIIRRLIDLGADVSLQDVYGNSPLDYAWTHPASFVAIRYPKTQYNSLDPSARSAVLWNTIRDGLERLLSIATPVSVEVENDRLLTLAVTATSFLYMRDKEYDQAIKYLFMELAFGAESADLRLNLDCDVCSISLNRLDLYLCRECHNIRLCTKCHENYTKGGETPNSTPDGVKELEQLEKAIQPLKEALLPIIDEIRLQFVFFIFTFFTSVQTWADTKRKEYEAWESKYNEDGHYKARKRPGQQLLKLLEEGSQLAKSIEEKGVEFDDEREDCASLIKRLSDYHRTHNVVRDYDEFYCSGHDYLHVSKKEYDQVVLNSHVFQPNRRLSSEWFRELLEKCPPVDTASKTESKPEQAPSGESSRTAAELQQPTDRNKESDEDECLPGTATTMVDRSLSQAANDNKNGVSISQDETPSSKADDAQSKDHAAPNKASEAPAKTRPKMPQGLRSSFTMDFTQPDARNGEEQKPVTDDKPVIEELRSPSDAAAAFSNLKGVDNEASAGRISNTKRFTAELLGRHHNLVRRVTSPTTDTGDPFEERSPIRRSTVPFSMIVGTQEWSKPENPTESNETSLTQEPESLHPSQENAEEVSAQPNTPERKIAVSISNTDNYGRLIMLALTVAESVSPGFGDMFITRRLEQGDLADYSLQVEVVQGAGGEG